MSDLSKRIESLSPKQRDLLRLQQQKRTRSPLPSNGAHPSPRSLSAEGRGTQDDSSPVERPGGAGGRGMRFSLFFFSDDGSKDEPDKYRLLIECAKFADANSFSAVWTPERHFQDFGGLYPNPSVLAAALAMITERVELRAGSVVVPLHNPVRIAEEWSVVDNLSRGRVAVSFASGWHPLDFVLAPESYPDRRERLFQNVRTIQDLWAGGSLALKGVDGGEVKVRIVPRPIQPRLPTWITIGNNPESWVRAGEMGAHVLTAIVRQPPDVLADRIRLYREARARHGHAPNAGQVAVMLHTFLGEDDETVKEQVRAPLAHYFRSNIKQVETQKDVLLKAAPTPAASNLDNMTDADLDVVAARAFERYFDSILLCGTPAKCSRLVATLADAGVDEIACLIDFGLPFDTVMEGLRHLNVLKKNHAPANPPPRAAHTPGVKTL
ncbi:MAG: LLM class flavin-dependent oxidoreductase [Acidobacteria bacterium]|nr:LLM class flavin-dependent oxidoreductase [Acidobacteriota bacterium]